MFGSKIVLWPPSMRRVVNPSGTSAPIAASRRRTEPPSWRSSTCGLAMEGASADVSLAWCGGRGLLMTRRPSRRSARRLAWTMSSRHLCREAIGGRSPRPSTLTSSSAWRVLAAIAGRSIWSRRASRLNPDDARCSRRSLRWAQRALGPTSTTDSRSRVPRRERLDRTLQVRSRARVESRR